MVQEFIAEPRVHKFTFEMVMVAYERRFPHCPLIPVVEDTEVTKDVWSPDNSQRETTRRARLKVEAPYLLRRVIGVDHVHFIQKTKMDLKKRTMDIEAINETFANRVNITEKCKYFVHPDDPQWTCFEQQATLHVISFYGCEAPIEKVAINQYAAMNSQAKQLIELFMEEVFKDGITELKPWSPSDPKYNLKLRTLIAHGAQPVAEAEPEAHGSGNVPMDQLADIGHESNISKKLSVTDLNKKSSPDLGKKSSPDLEKKSSPDLEKKSSPDLEQKSGLNLRRKSSSITLKPVLDHGKSTNLQNRDSEIIPPRTKKSEIVQQMTLDPPFPMKLCACDPFTENQESSLLTSWENLIITLLCTLVIIIAFSTMPLFFLFHERR